MKFISVGKERITGFLNSVTIKMGGEIYETKVILQTLVVLVMEF